MSGQSSSTRLAGGRGQSRSDGCRRPGPLQLKDLPETRLETAMLDCSARVPLEAVTWDGTRLDVCPNRSSKAACWLPTGGLARPPCKSEIPDAESSRRPSPGVCRAGVRRWFAGMTTWTERRDGHGRGDVGSRGRRFQASVGSDAIRRGRPASCWSPRTASHEDAGS